MIKLQTEQGEVSISDAALSNLTGAAATSCFGVKGMAYRSMTDGLVHLLRREAMSKGVRIMAHEEGDISIELHIIVEHGVNIAAVCRSIISQVRYMVSESTGAKIRSAVLVDVPDEIIADRIAGRRTCPKCKAGYHVKALPPKVEGICDKCGAELVIRKDDNPDTVKDRLVVYHRETEPLIAFYEQKGLLRKIDGNQGPEKNAAAFKAAM